MDIFEVVMLIRNKRPRKFPPGGVVGGGVGSCEGKTLVLRFTYKSYTWLSFASKNSLKLRT